MKSSQIVMNVCFPGNCLITRDLLIRSTYAGKRARKENKFQPLECCNTENSKAERTNE